MTDFTERFDGGDATVDLVDDLTAAGDMVRTCAVQFNDFGGLGRFWGSVRTIKCLEDNALIKELVATPGDGAVLVVDGGGSLRTALLGDVVAGSAHANGWAGLIINGAVRDRLALGSIPIGIRALGTNPRKSAKTGVGEIDVPVTFGDLTFDVGDTVFCDEDGILVIGPH